MEKKFLLYLLYMTLVELREHAYESNDKKTYWLCDLLHNVPLHLESDESAKETYNRLIEEVENLGMQKWIETRKKEFHSQSPEYKP
ncbi:MAG TPA: hypothetical protein VI489_00180 [Candidatus Brocadiaceae bacterium]